MIASKTSVGFLTFVLKVRPKFHVMTCMTIVIVFFRQVLAF